jgi:Protein of unknown function (DUF541)
MRIAIAVAGMAATGLVAGGVLVMAASAETTSTPAPTPALRTVSVQGVASEPLASTSSAETATTVYRQAMAAAILDGQAKAQFLAEKAGTTLGQTQNIGEGGGYISCPEGVEYQGGQPDFGSGSSSGVVAPLAESRAAPPTVHRAPPAKKPRKRHSARKAAAESCTLSTQVALVYQLS